MVHRLTNHTHEHGRIRVRVRILSGRRVATAHPWVAKVGILLIINIFMNPHFQACGCGTGPLIPTPRHGRGECMLPSILQPSRILAKGSLPVPFQYSGKCQDKPRSGIKTRTICLWAQLIHNWKHTLCTYQSYAPLLPARALVGDLKMGGYSTPPPKATSFLKSPSKSPPNPQKLGWGFVL